jgi:hypothetical protein
MTRDEEERMIAQAVADGRLHRVAYSEPSMPKRRFAPLRPAVVDHSRMADIRARAAREKQYREDGLS